LYLRVNYLVGSFYGRKENSNNKEVKNIMADISQIKLPNLNETLLYQVYDIKDALAVSSATFSGH